jgi:hypothetical protein
MDMFLFDDAVADVKIAINPDLVRFVRAGPDGRVTIVFDSEHSVSVRGTLEDVVSHLKS